MPEWLGGFIGGVIATVIGFILTMVWDIVKFNRESKRREETVLSAVREELVSNMSILEDNVQLLLKELEVIRDEKSVVAPLTLLQSGFWDLVKINLPRKLTKVDTLVEIRKVAQITEQVNEQIRSRENYRIHNQAMSNYHRRMRLYDEMILGNIAILQESLKEIEPLL